jgi:hypothetical protein
LLGRKEAEEEEEEISNRLIPIYSYKTGTLS